MGESAPLKSTDFPEEGFEYESSSLCCFRWTPTSTEELVKAESRMLQFVKCPLSKKYVQLESGEKLWTVIANPDVSDKTPLVMVHGFAGGVGFWAMNLDGLSHERSVYTFDLLGFARSSRPTFDESPEIAEETYIQSIEEWRHAVKIEKMILLGHSFGGYLSSCYAFKYPNRVVSLILADPWGFPEPDPDVIRNLPWYIRMMVRLVEPCNPLGVVRCCGPYGPKLIKRFRADFKQRFPEVTAQNENAVTKYIYHCNAGKPSGEAAFKQLNMHIGYAKNPIMNRIDQIDANIPVTFIYGEKSWMDQTSGTKVKEMLPNKVTVHVVRGEVGHHVYADDPPCFNKHVIDACRECDDNASQEQQVLYEDETSVSDVKVT